MKQLLLSIIFTSFINCAYSQSDTTVTLSFDSTYTIFDYPYMEGMYFGSTSPNGGYVNTIFSSPKIFNKRYLNRLRRNLRKTIRLQKRTEKRINRLDKQFIKLLQ